MQRQELPLIDHVASFLSQVSLFEHVGGDYPRQIAERLELWTYAEGETIFRQGDAADALYVIRAGAVAVQLVDDALGLEYQLARLRVGEVFGEMGILANEPRSATCKALDKTACFVLKQSDFSKIVERIPGVAIAVARVLAHRVTLLNRERGAKMIELSKLPFDPAVYKRVPARILEQHQMIPMSINGGVLSVACTDPDDLGGLDEIRRIIRGVTLEAFGVRDAEYRRFMLSNAARLAGPSGVSEQSTKTLGPVRWIADSDKEESIEGQGDEIRLLVDRIIAEALERGASDIHIEPERDRVGVRYRVSGRLIRRSEGQIPRTWHRPMTSRIKVLAQMDIAERRLPQDGRASLEIGGREIDLRISSLPSHEGEKVVVRLLDSQDALQPIDQLILADKVCRVVRQMVTRPHGVVYVCGPTGSGKTTTLYSALGILRNDATNVTTIEDPVEYNVRGITQVNVHPEIGLSFATILRSLLRQDPNVILVGETRDKDTGQLVLEAGLTGHLVLTSLHTTDAIGTIQRLREMQLANFAIAASMVGIISQRLVRRLCPACSTSAPIAPGVLEQLVTAQILAADFTGTLGVAGGCEVCQGTGFVGRVGAFEILVASDALKHAITHNANEFELRETALRGAYVPMSRYGHYLLTAGMTTPEEVLAIADV